MTLRLIFQNRVTYIYLVHKLQRSLSKYILNKLKTNVIIHNTFVSQALGKLLIPGLGYQGFKDLKWYTKEYVMKLQECLVMLIPYM